MENNVNRKPIHAFWDYMNAAMCAIDNAAMCAIDNAAVVAINNQDVLTHLKECGCHEETYNPIFWVIDYIEKMFKD